MKILFTITPKFNPDDGGVQRTTYKLGKFFFEQGYEVFYFSLAHHGHIAVQYGNLFHAKERGGDNNRKNIILLKKTIDTIDPDIVINQMPYESNMRRTLFQKKKEVDYTLIACLRNSLFSVKNNIDDYTTSIVPFGFNQLLHNSFGRYLLQKFHRIKHAKVLRSILDKHDFFVLLAPPNRDELEYFIGGYKSNKVFIIPNSIPVVHEEDGKKEKIILHVGRLNVTQKRSDLLLPIWKLVHPHLAKWKFVIVGDGPYLETLKQKVKDEKIPRVELLGSQNPDSYYKRASLFVMTSAFEGFPNVLLEAQSYGLIPVVFNSYPAVSWIVNQDKDGILIEPFNAVEFAKALIKTANDKVRLKGMSETSKENARKFTINRIGKQWMEFISENRIQ